MHKKIINTGLLFSFGALTFLLLYKNQLALSLSLEALNLWFQKMITALLPFMILSGLLINMELSDRFASLFSPVLRPLYRLSDSCLYCIIIGFLCGFPMGARVCAQSYEKGKISKREATLLLCFVNNIGPVYFTGYVLRLFPAQPLGQALFGMYGLPLLYGAFLRRTFFSDIRCGQRLHHTPNLTKPDALQSSPAKGPFFWTELNRSIVSSLDSITALGGYMIFCNLLNIIPLTLLGGHKNLLRILGALLEITGGLSRLPADWGKAALILLPFGGLSCIAQTASCIRDTDLSLKNYVFHKVILTVLTAAYYNLVGGI